MPQPLHPSDRGTGVRARWGLDPLHLVDVLVYVVVLNLAIEYLPSVISETFTLSLLTAIVLKLVLELVRGAKSWVLARMGSATTPTARVISAAMLLILLPGSKVLVLELIALLFGDSVKLGGFFVVTALIIVMLLARAGVRWLLGPPRDGGSR